MFDTFKSLPLVNLFLHPTLTAGHVQFGYIRKLSAASEGQKQWHQAVSVYGVRRVGGACLHPARHGRRGSCAGAGLSGQRAQPWLVDPATRHGLQHRKADPPVRRADAGHRLVVRL